VALSERVAFRAAVVEFIADDVELDADEVELAAEELFEAEEALEAAAMAFCRSIKLNCAVALSQAPKI